MNEYGIAEVDLAKAHLRYAAARKPFLITPVEL
jgi:hypothetical protein